MYPLKIIITKMKTTISIFFFVRGLSPKIIIYNDYYYFCLPFRIDGAWDDAECWIIAILSKSSSMKTKFMITGVFNYAIKIFIDRSLIANFDCWLLTDDCSIRLGHIPNLIITDTEKRVRMWRFQSETIDTRYWGIENGSSLLFIQSRIDWGHSNSCIFYTFKAIFNYLVFITSFFLQM